MCAQTLTNNPSTAQQTIDNLLELVYPTRCLGCEKRGVLLCMACASKLMWIDSATACQRCGAPYGKLICTECYSRTGPEFFNFDAAVCALSFDETVGRLIRGYKDQGERRVAFLLASCLAAALPPAWLMWADALTFIPAQPSAQRKRGFDHIEQVATLLAPKISLPLLRLLEKAATDDQRNLGREARFQNLAGAFRVKALPPSLFARSEIRLILIDDVFTTGATLNAAAGALKLAGASQSPSQKVEIRVATVARVW
ncbi:MAG: double zinc ribbon domain-containing protein [Coriobacteriales bacterium]|jgi:predicted amidophosphoribosyltransferase|nr:double zinc ribbon domain-containing protein [Coriobacteriales bacterium]